MRQRLSCRMLGAESLAGVRELYDRELRAQILDRW
jgi:hypothetical protein